MTNSSSFRALPCHSRAYKSSTRPALIANSGSRGNTQLRWYQGRMASSCNQRHRVLPLMEATRPLCWTCCTRSLVLHRDSGRPCFAGSSQAKALICTTSSGGKSPGATRTSMLFQPSEAIGKEALAPKGDYFTAGVQACGDLVVRQTLSRVQDHLGPLDLKIR
jgi:hypothetical protein